MKSRKVSIVAIMATAVALVLIVGAGIGFAAGGPGHGPVADPRVADDLVSMGDAGGSAINLIDPAAGMVVRTISGGAILNNHGTLFTGPGLQYMYTGDASQIGGNLVVAKQDLWDPSQPATALNYAVTGGGAICGVEWQQNNPASDTIWAERMSDTVGGAYTYVGGVANAYIDTNPTGNNNTCGVGWNATGTTAYASLMNAKRTNDGTGPAGPYNTNGGVLHADSVHIMDVNKASNYAYTSHGTGGGIQGGGIYIIDISGGSMTAVGDINTDNAVTDAYSNTHSVQVDTNGTPGDDSDDILYAHSRIGESSSGQNYGDPAETGALLVYDIGANPVNPPLLGVVADEGSGGSCGVDVTVKSSYCAAPSLSLSLTGASWANPGDYPTTLTVGFAIGNSVGSVSATDVTINGTVNTNGATSNVPPAMSIGAVTPGGSTPFSLVYTLANTNPFVTTVYVTATDLCNNTYNYPGPFS